MSNIKDFTDEQRRILVNIEQHYEVWLETARAVRSLPYGLKWVSRGGHEYLYERLDRNGNARSLGPRSLETEAIHAAYIEKKRTLEERLETSSATLEQTCQLYRSLRLPAISSEGAKLLREADLRGMLGRSLIVVGTNALAAYSIEAGGFIKDIPDRTDDFDMTWIAAGPPRVDDMVLAMLKSVDSTYTMNTERTFQARNAKAHEFELLAAPSTIEGMNRTDQPKPIPLPEQEWLLLGRHVSHVVVALDGSPARIVAPDPRWFALQKLWMSQQAKRSPLKRPKDAVQGASILDAVRDVMPQFPLDEEFEASIPDELKSVYSSWKEAASKAPPARSW